MYNFWHQFRKPIIALAPMEGVTDSPFRQICKEHGADLVYTEFISSDAIGRNARRAFEKMVYDLGEQPVICQIFGCNPEMFVAAAQEVERRGFAGIDINFGCPARSVMKSGGGVALLRKPAYARELIERILDVVHIPISIKVRTKIRAERKEVAPGASEWHTALDLVDAIQDLPVSAMLVHGRAYEQGHSGEVDTEMIRQVKRRFRGIVLANGGIFTPERAKEMLAETGADGVAIARGSQGNPWIFSQTKNLLSGGTYTPPTWEERTETMMHHAALAEKQKGRWGIIEMRKHLGWYVHGFAGAAKLRQQLVRVTSLADAKSALDQCSAQEEIQS